MPISDKWKDEYTKTLIDVLDSGGKAKDGANRINREYDAYQTSSSVYGQMDRHHYRCGTRLIIDLARKFPDATAEEIAEATGRDMAPIVLHNAGITRERRRLRQSCIRDMRAVLVSIT